MRSHRYCKQISPTKEILSGDHRKLNQLPSLARSNSTTEAPKLPRLQKAKAKARAKLKEPRASLQQESNNANANLSRGQDATSLREEADTIDDGPRAQFKRQEHHVLSKLFALMDVDGSGTVNQKEMRWALQRDAEIHALAKTSPQLRLLLKQRARLEALFSKCTNEGRFGVNADSDVRDDCSDELSWEEFLSRCEESYLNLMAEGLIQPDIFVSARPDNRSRESPISTTTDLKTSNLDELSEKATEAQTIRRVFSLLDMDHNGVLDVAEIQRALYHSASKTRPNSTGSTPSELQRLVRGSRALQPLLHQELFMAAFSKFEPLDPRGISEEEFVAFCLEIAQVAAVNNMVTSVG
ncbi:unnamed protein product [Phytophthora lilii]|uniref:Unnamed protein product n=1 Tax=Phytophthora lilii TaxID=2077276 RepID=A0A9W6YD42_9STRA|nr:unnamed protein product [Phytophthora lilii]